MPRKSSKGKGGKKGGKAGKDPVTGRYMQETEDGRTFLVRDDGIYKSDVSNNAIIPLASVPPEINGIHIEYPDGIIQWQLGGNAVVMNSSRSTYRRREVYLGDFIYDKNGRLTSGKVEFRAALEEKPSDPTWIGGNIYQVQDTLYRPPTEWDNYGIEIVDDDDPATGGLPAIRAFGGGKYFFEGWDNNVFDTTIV